MAVSHALHGYTKLHNIFYLDYSNRLLTCKSTPVTSFLYPQDKCRMTLYMSDYVPPLIKTL